MSLGWTIVVSLAVFQGTFLACVFWIQKRGNRVANRTLACLLFLLSFALTSHLLPRETGKLLAIGIFIAQQALPFLYGPLLFLYVRVSFEDTIDYRNQLPAFLPAIGVFICVPVAVLAGLASRIEESTLRIGFYALFSAQILHMLLYNILIFRFFRQQTRVQGNARKPLSGIRIRWFRQLLWGYTLFLVLMILFLLLLVSGAYYSYPTKATLVTIVVVSFLIHFVAFKSMLNPEIIVADTLLRPAKRYQGSALTPEKSLRFRKQLEHHMADAKPHQDSELKLQQLAEDLSIQPHYISQVINEHYQMNFFDFINSYRIEDAKQKLLRPALNKTILAIAYEVGFNSKTAFNRAFKKQTHMTPSEFRKAHIET